MNESNTQLENIVTVQEIATLFDVHVQTVRTWIHEGRLPGSKQIGTAANGMYFVPRDSVVAHALARIQEIDEQVAMRDRLGEYVKTHSEGAPTLV